MNPKSKVRVGGYLMVGGGYWTARESHRTGGKSGQGPYRRLEKRYNFRFINFAETVSVY